jgi:hypothetical protein
VPLAFNQSLKVTRFVQLVIGCLITVPYCKLLFIFYVRLQRGFQKVRPDDGYYPGISRLREDLQSHQWIFGKTPRFKVCRSFELPNDIMPTAAAAPSSKVKSDMDKEIRIELDVHLGVVQVGGIWQKFCSASFSLKFGLRVELGGGK